MQNETQEYQQARLTMANRWVPACGGHETSFVYRRRQWLYVYNFATGKHGWLDLGQDIVFDQLPA